ncbi:MAG: hypothetical protein H6Q90_2621, partial [Deltaproteobacteria bacterium]|nr:hypothetical protein [Deltaproteobacteria bacterium]
MKRTLTPMIVGVWLILPTTVWASPKVAVTAIDGDSGDVRNAVAAALDGNGLTLIGMRDVNRAVDKLGDAAELTTKNAKKLAKDLKADAVVQGSIDDSGVRKTLRLKLFLNGKKAHGFSVRLKNVKSQAFKSKIRHKMV